MTSENTPSSIYEFESASTWLKSIFEQKKSRNSKYSLRSFAKVLDISHSSLVRLFQNKTALSKENVKGIAEKLQLSQTEKYYFEQIAENPVDTAILDGLRIRAKSHTMNVEDVASILNMHAFAVLQMIEVDRRVKFSVPRAAEKLSISQDEIRDMLEKLLKLNLIKNEKNRYTCTNERLLIQSDEAKAALHRYYKSTLSKSIEKLDQHTAKERYIGTETITLDDEDLSQAQKIIDEALDRIAALSKKAKNPKDVYQYSTVLFRLTEKDRP